MLRHPAGDQIFVTTTPGGAFNFLFTICIATGVVASIPVITYQVLRYAQPVLKEGFMRLMVWGSIASGLLAISGIVFGYFFGLPNSLKFLFGQSTNLNIEAMITIDSYASFVTMYLLGAALLFQVPLVLLLINRIKPLTPSQLFKAERPFVIASFIFGAIISPSPNIQDMLILAIPTIVMYQFSMIMIWIINRKHRRPRKVLQLRKQDAQLQAERLAKFHEAQQAWQRALQNARTSHTKTKQTMLAQPAFAAQPNAKVPALPAVPVVAAPQAASIPPRPTVIAPIQPTRRPTARRQFSGSIPRRPHSQRKFV